MSQYELLRQILAGVQSANKQLAALTSQLIKQGTKEMAALDAIKSAVTNETSVEASAIALLKGLADALAALAAKPTVDPAEVQSLADQINANADTLAAAVTANTPAA